MPTSPCSAFMQTQGSPSPDAFRKALGQADRFTAQVGYFGAGGNFRAEALVVVDGKIKELLQKDHPWSSRNRFGDIGRQSIPYPHRRGERIFHGSSWFWKSNDFSSLSQESKTEELARIEELRDSVRKLRKQLEDLGTPPKFYGVVKTKTMETIRIHERGNRKARPVIRSHTSPFRPANARPEPDGRHGP